MRKQLAKYSPQLYALMRIVVGLAFAQHGVQKLFGALGGTQVQLLSRAGVAGVVELVAGVLIAVGFMTSWAAFVASGQMAVAYFLVHFPNGFWPVQNRGELAVLYCFVFLYVAAVGNGTWSLGGSRRAKGGK